MLAKILLKVLYMGSSGSSSSSSWMYSTSTSLVSLASLSASSCRRRSASWAWRAQISGRFFFFLSLVDPPYSLVVSSSSSSWVSSLEATPESLDTVSSAAGGGPAGWLLGGVIFRDRLGCGAAAGTAG